MKPIKHSIIDDNDTISFRHVLALVQTLSAGSAIKLSTATTLLSPVAETPVTADTLRAIDPRSLEQLTRTYRTKSASTLSASTPSSIVSQVDGHEVISRKHLMVLLQQKTRGEAVTPEDLSIMLSALTENDITLSDVAHIHPGLMEKVVMSQKAFMKHKNPKTQRSRDNARNELFKQLRLER
ncbi:MAG: hypothetical protein WAZ18_03555 [Alphaproteobacteria bacterium]